MTTDYARCLADISAVGPPMNDDGTPYVCVDCKTGSERDADLRAALSELKKGST